LIDQSRLLASAAVRVPSLLLLGSILALGAVSLRGQQGDADADKRKQFLRAREEMRTIPATPTPASETAPAPKPKPKPVATPKPASGRPTPLLIVTPRPGPVPPAPHRVEESSAPVNVVKESVNPQDILPAEPEHGGWFSGPKYNYLTRAIRAELDRAPVARNRWRYIVVHNSGTRQGSAKAFDYYHLHVRKMVNGLAYHFVIGNGSSTGDGAIEIGNRWRRQINGGHVHSDYLNNIALGICLVGDYNRDTPTKRQLEALDELIRYLRKRVGKVDGKVSIVKAHREINPPRWPTDCPGDHFPYQWLHSRYD
jgi:N-acetylmuramoyl-L-alanine amidase